MAGLHGNRGDLVRRLVTADHKRESELVVTRRREMVDALALVQDCKDEGAIQLDVLVSPLCHPSQTG